jgi:signal transduction histidine kinase
MTVAGLERALGMLLLDAAFCERFFLNPRSATWEAGLPLSPIEVDALSRLSRVAIAPSLWTEGCVPGLGARPPIARALRRCSQRAAVCADRRVQRRRDRKPTLARVQHLGRPGPDSHPGRRGTCSARPPGHRDCHEPLDAAGAGSPRARRSRLARRPLGNAALGDARAQVVQRAPDNLTPLDVVDPPAEVAPLVVSLNRLLERVRASIDSERRFTADAAHELRTPVAAIRAHAEVARAATGDDERRAALDSVLAGCDRAAHAIQQLLTLARLDPGDPREQYESCDLRAAAKETLADLAPAAIAKGLDLELTPGAPAVIHGSRGLLVILLRNVVDNAVRYSAPGGSIRVDVLQDSRTVRLVVTDQGPGVPVADRQALGERFYRVPGSLEPGTGLGLSIVRRIAELHRADVQFRDGAGGRGLAVVVEFSAPDEV